MENKQKLSEIKEEYVQKFKNLAKEFKDKTGLLISDVSFGYPMHNSDEEKLLENTRVRIGVEM